MNKKVFIIQTVGFTITFVLIPLITLIINIIDLWKSSNYFENLILNYEKTCGIYKEFYVNGFDKDRINESRKILNDRGVNIREDNKSFEAQVCEVLDRNKKSKG